MNTFYLLNFTRFIAASMVVIYHGICLDQEVFPFSTNFFKPFFIKGNFAVLYFFLLSGIIMSVSNDSKNIKAKQFYINRFSRIYPTYILGIFLVLIFPFVSRFLDIINFDSQISIFGIVKLSLIEFFQFFKSNLKGIILNIFLIQAWTVKYFYSVSPQNWSLSVEIFFYFLFPIYFKYFCYYKKEKILFFSIFLFFSICFLRGYLMVYHFEIGTLIYDRPLGFLHIFIFGNGLGWWLKNTSSADWVYFRNILGTFFFILLGMYLVEAQGFLGQTLILETVGFSLIIVSILTLKNLQLINLLKWKWSVLLGNISYSIYIFHSQIALYVSFIFKKYFFLESTLFYISFLIVLIFSFIHYQYIEIKVTRYLKDKLTNFFYNKITNETH